MYFRAIYKPAGIDGKARPASENVTSSPVAITILRNTKVKAVVSAPRYASRKRSVRIDSAMTPNSGIGVMQVTIWKKGFKRVYLVPTEDDGIGTLRVKLKKSTYNVQTRWMGNAFGKSAKSKVKKITVR